MNEQPTTTPATPAPTTPQTPEPAPGTPENEGRFHRYRSSRVPWYVHVLWLLFWVFAVAYVLRYLLPAIKVEFLSPP
jgi:hypothetical protein